MTTETNILNISDKPHEGYEPIFYTKAQYFTSRLWSQLSSVQQEEFTEYAGQLHVILREKMINILKIEDNGLTTHELSVLFSKDVNSGKLSPEEVMELQMFTLALHQNYVKKIIRLFNLKPEDFDTTPSKFCNVFDHCQFIIENTTSEPVEEFSSEEINPGGEFVNCFR